MAYAYATRYLSTSPLSSVSADDPDFQEAHRIISDLAPFLTDRKSKILHSSLSGVPSVLGATLGVEEGNLIRMRMNERDEYVGRALNIACRLQDAVKEKEPHPECYKAMVSARLFNERLAQLSMPYKVESETCSLRNVLSGSGFACRKIDFTVDTAGQELPWPTHETPGRTCARSNWESPP